ncbi:MAG TPA: response regulator [Spirochaetota bacterium]|nr:response regulator [Spirochaetota bacterium]HQO39412.1 response regulator [Spirochaetota bacterium]
MKTRLVVIDDEEYIRIPIQDFFEDCGWEVVPFATAEDALEYLEDNSADCVIVDVRLPGMTGPEFIIKAVERRPGIRCVIYTGSFDFSITDELRSAGVDNSCLVRKPALDFGDIKCAVEGPGRGKVV